MAHNERWMDPAKVRQAGQQFDNFGKILKAVSNILEVQIRILDTTAFMGLVGGQIISSYLKIIEPKIEQLAKECLELSEWAIKSAKDWEQATSGDS